MGEKLLFAKPVAEAVIRDASVPRVVWRSYLWNSGREVRLWFVDPETIDNAEIDIQCLQHVDTTPGQ